MNKTLYIQHMRSWTQHLHGLYWQAFGEGLISARSTSASANYASDKEGQSVCAIEQKAVLNGPHGSNLQDGSTVLDMCTWMKVHFGSTATATMSTCEELTVARRTKQHLGGTKVHTATPEEPTARIETVPAAEPTAPHNNTASGSQQGAKLCFRESELSIPTLVFESSGVNDPTCKTKSRYVLSIYRHTTRG